MFLKDDYVIYGTEGVCRITDIRLMAFDVPMKTVHAEERRYYILSPVNKSDALIYVPIESEALVSKMRRVLTKGEIDSAIEKAKTSPLPDLSDRKRRGVIYKAVCDSMKCEHLLTLIRALYERRSELLESGKKLSFSDGEMLTRCEMLVANEFAFSLGIEKNEVASYIRERFEQE